MKIKSVVAVGAMGLGMGVAGLVGGTATASAEECGEVPIGITPGNIICNVTVQAGTFAESISPQRNIGILLYGEETSDDPNVSVPSGLGLVDQPSTFVNSIVGQEDSFLSGPRSPDFPSQPAAPHAPGG
jgi:hypothetical protein